MSIAHFDENGSLLVIVDIAGMEPPSTARYSADVESSALINDIYFDVSTKEVRQKRDFELRVSRNMIEGIPAGSQVIFGTYHAVVDDGSLEFDANVEQVVPVFVTHLEYKNTVVEVNTGP